MTSTVYPLFEIFTDSSYSTIEKNKILLEFRKHVKREFINVSQIENYFNAFLYYLYDKKHTLFNSSSSGSNSGSSGTQEHDDNLLSSFHTNLYTSFCHLIKRTSMQSPISLTPILMKKIIVVLLDLNIKRSPYGDTTTTTTTTTTNNNNNNNNNNIVDDNSKKALISLYLAKNDLIDDVLLNGILLDGKLNNDIVKYNVLKFIINDVFQLIGIKNITDKKNYLLEKYIGFFEHQIRNMTHGDNENDDDDDDDKKHLQMLNDLCLQICNDYNLPLTTSTQNFVSSEHEVIQEKETHVFDDIETELKRINSLKTNSSTTLVSSVRLSPVKNFTSIEYIFKELSPYTQFFDSKETELNWKKRQIFILKLRSFISHSEIIKDNAQVFLKIFKDSNYPNHLNKAIHSLRTTLATNACLLVKDLCSKFGKKIDFLQEFFFDILKPLLSNTKKISVNNAHLAILSILSYCSFNKRIFHMAYNLSKDKNVQPKVCSCDYLRIYIIKSTYSVNSIQSDTDTQTNHILFINSEEFLGFLKNWIENLISTPQVVVRSYAKTVFWYFYKIQPKIASKILNDLSLQLRKSLSGDIPKYLNINLSSSQQRGKATGEPPFKKFKAQSHPVLALETQTVNNHLSRASVRAHSDSSLQKTPISMKLSSPMDSLSSRRNIKSLGQESVSKVPRTYTPTRDTHSAPLDNGNFSVATLISALRKTLTEDETKFQTEKILNDLCTGLSFLDTPLIDAENEELINVLRDVILKKPLVFHQVISSPTFMQLYQSHHCQYMNHLIELYAINNEYSINNLLSVSTSTQIFQCILNKIFNHGMTTDLNSSIFYVNYRKLILDYSLRSCIKLMELKNDTGVEDSLMDGNSYETALSVLLDIYGKSFNEEIYFELINILYLLNESEFVKVISKQPQSLKFKISEGLQQKNENFNMDLIMEEPDLHREKNFLHKDTDSSDMQLDPAEGAELEVKAMEMTMVNPWKDLSKKDITNISENRIVSASTVVLHAMDDTARLSEFTKIIPSLSFKSKPIEPQNDPDEDDVEVINISDIFENSIHAETLSPIRIENGSACYQKKEILLPVPAEQDMDEANKDVKDNNSLKVEDIRETVIDETEHHTDHAQTENNSENNSTVDPPSEKPKEIEVASSPSTSQPHTYSLEELQQEAFIDKSFFKTSNEISSTFVLLTSALLDIEESDKNSLHDLQRLISQLGCLLTQDILKELSQPLFKSYIEHFTQRHYVFDNPVTITMIDTVVLVCHNQQCITDFYFCRKASELNESQTVFILACLQQIIRLEEVLSVDDLIVQNLTHEQMKSDNAQIRHLSYRIIGDILNYCKIEVKLLDTEIGLIKRFN